MKTKTVTLLSALLAAAVGSPAFAQDTPTSPAPDPATRGEPLPEATPYEADYGTDDESIIRRYGLSLSLGGGVMDFTDETMRDTTGVGGLWDVRVGFLTNTWIGAEIAYIGGLQSIDALGLDDDARLLSTALEANARVNFLQGRWTWQPYVFAGLAWKRYQLNNVETNLSSVEDEDDLMEIPVGLGVGFRMSGFLVDLRGTFRPAVDSDLVPERNSTEVAPLHNWMAAARIGYAF